MADYSGTGADHTVTVRRLYQALQQMKDKMHPVGSIYMSMDSTSPASLFGGTWEQLKDRFMLAAGNTYKAGSTGGESKHTLTEYEMPSHAHKVMYAGGNTPARSKDGVIQANLTYGWNRGIGWFADNKGTVDVWAAETGGDQPHNNMPPYLVVYMWKRIA